jgi:SAM-dependent methyltransferase
LSNKIALRRFLAQNPYPGPLTDGLFYRDKMRAIHRIAPQGPVSDILEVGGGESGLSTMLYPQAQITNLDMDPALANAPCNQRDNVVFVEGDATNLPFEAESFDMVTMFDLLEHVEDDRAAAREALRVLRPGGFALISTPHRLRWRYPYYRFLAPICPGEPELFERWGHVRRGYDEEQLDELFGLPACARSGFINPLVALGHDISFSRLRRPVRWLLHLLISPISLLGWLTHGRDARGTEVAVAWQKPS